MAKQCKITYKGKEYNEDDFNFIVLNSMLNSIKDKNNNFDDSNPTLQEKIQNTKYYHVSDIDIESFDKTKISSRDVGFYGRGFYFSETPQMQYGNIVNVFTTDVSNTYLINQRETGMFISKEIYNKHPKEIQKLYGWSEERIMYMTYPKKLDDVSRLYTKNLKEKGYDSVLFDDGDVKELVVFDDKNIHKLYQNPFSEKNNNELSEEQDKAISNLFESNPELKDIFNNDKSLYQQYLNSIFPNSQVKNIVHHGTRTQDKFEEFDENKIGELDSGYFGKGFYFSPDLDYANGYSKLYDGYNIAAIVDLQNPLETDANKANSGVSLSNNDGAIVRVGENLLPSLNTVESDPNEIGEIVVKSAKQIHILGSKKDIMMAKKFVENTSEKSSTLNLSTLGITQEEFNQLTKQEQEQLTKCYV
jgi:hypothetical protein